jgi:serine/threonine protein kinase
MEHERVIMTKFNFPNIIEFKTDFYYNANKPYCSRSNEETHEKYTHHIIILEYFGKELKLNNFNGIYNENRVLEIFVQILLGFKYLHDQNISHRNISLKVYLLFKI